MKILGIESSCDETAAAVIEKKQSNFNILSNVISSQVKVHAKYGGIVPEVAARLHVENILPIIDLALKESKTKIKDIDYISVCSGPGLVSSLMVGVEAAKSLALVHKKKLIKVNHIEGHILSVLSKNMKLNFPILALIVSGGHTQLILIKDYLKYKIIGGTRDDAVGEAFDKVAKILDLGYPGGPVISKLADEVQDNVYNIKLPRPMIDKHNLEMSFSGLKTACLYTFNELKEKFPKRKWPQIKKEFAKEFQEAVVDVLVAKTIKAAKKYQAQTIILGGGVSANKQLREGLAESIKRNLDKVKFYCPDMTLTGDNAAMIAMAGYYHQKVNDFVEPFNLKADPNWELV